MGIFPVGRGRGWEMSKFFAGGGTRPSRETPGWCHQKAAHSGRNVRLNEIKTSGYWVIQVNSAVKEVISRCVTCRWLRGKVGNQIMVDLPQDRLKEEPPFAYCGVDKFGQFEIKKEETS